MEKDIAACQKEKNMDFIEEMKNSGVDTDNALERFIGNTAFLEKMLKKCLQAYKIWKFSNI